VGKPVLVGGPAERAANEVVCFKVWPWPTEESASNTGVFGYIPDRSICLEVASHMTRETASSVLQFFLLLGNYTYLESFFPSLYIFYARQSQSFLSSLMNFFFARQDRSFRYSLMVGGSRLNPAIFTALRQANGGSDLKIYLSDHQRPDLQRLMATIMFGDVVDGLKVHFR
jgi:hypothetical protein